MNSPDYKSLLNLETLATWLEDISDSDSNSTIRASAKQIAYQVRGNKVIFNYPYYTQLFQKYKFKLINNTTSDGLGIVLYSLYGLKQKLIGLVQDKTTPIKRQTIVIPPYVPPIPESLNFGVLFSLAGGITPTSIKLSSKINNRLSAGQTIKYILTTNLNDPTSTPRFVSNAGNIESYLDTTGSILNTSITGLNSNTTYYYWLYDNKSEVYVSSSRYLENYTYLGKFKTFPDGSTPYRFSASYASCMTNDSTALTYKRIATYSPNIFIHMGDLFYWDGSTEPNYLNDRESVYQSVFASGSSYIKYPSSVANPNYYPLLIKEIAMDYIWDDHDYGPNNSDGTFINRAYGSQAVDTILPHHTFPSSTSFYESASVTLSTKALYHTYNAGRIKFIVTDNRSQRSPYTDPDSSSKVIWDNEQESWFMSQMQDTTYPVKVWVNSFPWEGDDTNPLWTGDDGWEKYTTYRSKIADFFTSHSSSIGKIIILSGDAHMTSMDDGTLSPWYGSGSRINPPITIHQSAPLDQGGSRKGGPYILNGSDIWQSSTLLYKSGSVNYNNAISGLTSSYINTNNRYGCMEVYDDLSNITIDMYSRSGTTVITSSAGDQRFPSVNGAYKKFRLTLNTSNYINGSGGKIIETRTFV